MFKTIVLITMWRGKKIVRVAEVVSQHLQAISSEFVHVTQHMIMHRPASPLSQVKSWLHSIF